MKQGNRWASPDLDAQREETRAERRTRGRRLAARFGAVAGAMTLMGTGATVNQAQAAVACGAVVTTDTTLTADLSCPSGRAIRVNASNVTSTSVVSPSTGRCRRARP